ncbi:MAG: hypothetical protein JWQ27_532 [Ferruginibacter sp.]|nr:hypothetical protein [Ferruginibacter sp.]
MKKIFRSGLLALMGISLFANTIEAAAVLPSTSVEYVTVPYAPPTEVPAPSLKSALADFKGLSKRERKLRMKEVKKQLKELKQQKKNGNAPSTNQTLLIILAILLPPLAVYLHEGVINSKFWIDLLLTLLFFLPGVIYALVVVLNKD